MSDIAIKIENLSKQYRLGLVGTGTLSHDLNRWWYRMRGKEDPYLKIGEANDRASQGNSEYVWALKDIDFEVKKGEILGIIGKNGAGKSTLLKILSKVTGPTTGSVRAKGRIGSLLEVGTGFHPELTGRENIYLNGTILGMTRQEVSKKLDEIVEFAGVARYLDTPVKRYSSGMMVRLGFAVAAHLEPEILVVDEVLAVGDAEFQKKAIGKMKDVSKGEGRTVLFVSHNMSSINNLCMSCIWLQNGQIAGKGATSVIVQKYLSQSISRIQRQKWGKDNSPGDESVRIYEVAIHSMNCNNRWNKGLLKSSHEIEVEIKLETFEMIEGFRIGFDLISEKGELIFRSFHNDGQGKYQRRIPKGRYNARTIIPSNLLNQGIYFIDLRATIYRVRRIALLERVLSFEVVNVDGINVEYGGADNKPGIISPILNWQIEVQ